jgi:TonB family protein
VPPPAQEAIKPTAVTDYKPADEFQLKKKLIMAAAGVLILIAAFGAGFVINKNDAPKNAPETIEEQMAEGQPARVTPVKRADTQLVPMNEPGGIDQPVTSAPVAGQPGTDDYQRTDATAVSAIEYAELAKRAHAEKERMAVLVDPRSLTGPAYAQQGDRIPVRRPAAALPPGSQAAAQQQVPLQPQQQIPTPPPMTSAGGPAASAPPPQMQHRRASLRTRPVPEYQPLPQISARGTARLTLTIGADGRVREVGIDRPLMGGNTAALIRAVQRWRFKPATENGEPVSAPYSVEISFGR